jgi:predicted PurR-regulated permease PerM
VKVQNPFRTGLFAGLGVIAALVIGGAVGSLSTILTYVGAAVFLALGLDPLVTWLEKHRIKRPIAILISLVGVLGIFTGLVFAVIPVVVEQITNLVTQVSEVIIPGIQDGSLLEGVKQNFAWLPVDYLLGLFNTWIKDKETIKLISNGLWGSGVTIASGLFGAVIVMILVIYFTASLGSLKRGVYQLVPATKRPRFVDLSEQISDSVGRYVIGQVSLALCNGVLSFLLLTFIFPLVGLIFPSFLDTIKYAALLAFIAFLGSLIPLVGTLSASVVIVLSVFLFNDFNVPTTVLVAAWYLVYMQVEAYVLNPRIMARAVKVPGVVVVVAALVGGTLLGILGALIAIPVAAAVQLIIREVIVPRQNEL